MKHTVSVNYSGEGLKQVAQVVCSCGYKSPQVFAYAGHYWTNQHNYRHNHLMQVKWEARS